MFFNVIIKGKRYGLVLSISDLFNESLAVDDPPWFS